MFGKLGTGELILILGIALVIFGPGKLPEVGKAFGKAIGEFKSHANKVSKDIEIDLNDKK
ncbi:twin-arginine translocase TatA/TatE family subunit [Tissierella carlieri]|jgi:sec-independent protein translocase protein TatA|uniref:twin-arginine translocase TatA/TatE family subunit n=1 Tax=Tissierella carlieri TaxID=689904 RepID=UPI0028048417|nr:twin-arginine translocase TatA/TatE family subunit [uncultured Tissierella sp.]MDU5081793.1 twin-arginine translocase TatA/TatE family subunit [Bacillota bacterium]